MPRWSRASALAPAPTPRLRRPPHRRESVPPADHPLPAALRRPELYQRGLRQPLPSTTITTDDDTPKGARHERREPPAARRGHELLFRPCVGASLQLVPVTGAMVPASAAAEEAEDTCLRAREWVGEHTQDSPANFVHRPRTGPVELLREARGLVPPSDLQL